MHGQDSAGELHEVYARERYGGGAGGKQDEAQGDIARRRKKRRPRP